MKTKITSLFFLILFSLSSKAEFNSNFLLLNTEMGIQKNSSLSHLNRGGGNHRGPNAYKTGNVIISLGYGALNFWKYEWANNSIYNYNYYTGESSLANYKVTGVGPIHFKAEYALSDIVSLGLSVNYVSAHREWTNYYSYYGQSYANGYSEGENFSSLSVLGRMNIHFATSKILDPYVGFGVGYRNSKIEYYSNDPTYIPTSTAAIIPVGFEMSFGLRVYVSPNIGFFTEVGLTKSLIQGGLAIKI